MRVRPTLVIVAALLVPVTALARAPIVAVFDVQVSGVSSVDAGTAERLADFVAGRLAASGAFEVVPRSQVKARLQQAKSESYKECYDQACQVELGREMAAEKSVSVEVLRLGKSCTVNISLYDLARATTEAADSGDGACDEEGVIATLKTTVAHLVDTWKAGEDRRAAAAPVRPPEKPAAPGSVTAARVPPGLGLTEDQWRGFLRNVGVDRSKDLANEYLATVGPEGATGAATYSFNDFLDERRVSWKRVRDAGMGTSIVGIAAVIAGVVWGAVEATSSAEYDDRIPGFAGMIPAGVAILLVGAPLWGVYQSRLDDLDAARAVGAPKKAALRWTGLAPIYDPVRQTRGAAVSFTF